MGFTDPVPDYMLKECQGCKSKQTIITSVHLLMSQKEHVCPKPAGLN